MNVDADQVIRPRDFLLEELTRRSKANSRYSLRAFARCLGITPAGLSLILSGKRGLTQKTATKVAARLGLNPLKTKAFLNGCLKRHSFLDESHYTYEQISLDEFSTIAEWYHFAILSLIEVVDFKPSIFWIATRLEISVAEAKSAMERLVRLGILDISGKKWIQSRGPILVENKISTTATRSHQKQVLEKALYSLENDGREIRDISSVTMAIDPELLPFAEEEIRKFRNKLMETLERMSKKKKEVYHLAVQIYPVTRKKD